MFAYTTLLLTLLLNACAWRAGDAEHYIGPILFRYSAPPNGRLMWAKFALLD